MKRLPPHHTIIYRNNHFHAAFPTAAADRAGNLLVAFRRARDPRYLLGPGAGDPELARIDHLDCRSHIALLRLAPDLTPRGDVELLPVDGEAADQDANLLRLRDGRLIQTGFCWYPLPPWMAPAVKARGAGIVGAPAHHGVGYIFWGSYSRWSDDDGRTWSARRDFPVVPGFPDLVPGVRPYFGGPVRGRAVELADGTLLQAAYGIHPATGQGTALLHASTDRGESWQYRGVIAHDPAGQVGFLEPALHATADGKVFAFHRTTGLDGRVAVSASHDRGMSWTPCRPLAAKGLPCDICTLPDGRALLIYGRRHPPFGIRARWWDSDREDLVAAREGGREIVIRRDAPSPDVGYPWAIPHADGRITVFYYSVDPHGLRHIAASTISP